MSAASASGSVDALLEVRDLRVEYTRDTGAIRVLDGVNLAIHPGESLGVVGESGAGKTVLGVQLLLEGALKQGKRGMLVSLDEHPAQILRNAATLGMDLNEQIDKGMIRVLYDSPQELEIDAHFDRIVRTIEEHKIERLLIDGMTSYSSALGDQGLYRDFIHSLVAYSKNDLMTAFFSYENPELFGLSNYMPDFAISSIVDNLILMNFVELGKLCEQE